MNTQKGFAHTILVITLIIAIIGVLGFIFWRNFVVQEPVAVNTENNTTPLVVDEDEYSFTVVDGFNESSEQMFTYTGSLRSVKTFVNEKGDYFEVLISHSAGGGISGDYRWTYTVEDSGLVVRKSDRCELGDFACTADNGSVEGFISHKDKTNDYYIGFGNKSKNEINLEFVDKFISTFRFK